MPKSNSMEKYIDSLKFGLPVASTTLCVVGTFANITSLVYFVKKKEKTTGDKLLMLLNTVDLLLCFIATVETACISYLAGGNGGGSGYIIIAMVLISVLYLLLIDGTAYVTCLLSVTRAIGIVHPFYRLRGKLFVVLGIIVFIVIEFVQLVPLLVGLIIHTAFYLNYGRLLISLLVMLIVLCATIVAVYKLTRADLQGATENVSRNNRKATWTVVILSVLFLVFNSIVFGVTSYFFANHQSVVNEARLYSLMFYGLFLAIPLNSSINPIVYLTRRSDMRKYLKQRFQKFYSHFRRETLSD